MTMLYTLLCCFLALCTLSNAQELLWHKTLADSEQYYTVFFTKNSKNLVIESARGIPRFRLIDSENGNVLQVLDASVHPSASTRFTTVGNSFIALSTYSDSLFIYDLTSTLLIRKNNKAKARALSGNYRTSSFFLRNDNILFTCIGIYFRLNWDSDITWSGRLARYDLRTDSLLILKDEGSTSNPISIRDSYGDSLLLVSYAEDSLHTVMNDKGETIARLPIKSSVMKFYDSERVITENQIFNWKTMSKEATLRLPENFLLLSNRYALCGKVILNIFSGDTLLHATQRLQEATKALPSFIGNTPDKSKLFYYSDNRYDSDIYCIALAPELYQDSVILGFDAIGTTDKKDLPINFRSYIFPSQPVAQYRWQFGDGSTDTIASPTHTYSTAGEYTVSLEVVLRSGDTLRFQREKLCTIAALPRDVLWRRYLSPLPILYVQSSPDAKCIAACDGKSIFILNAADGSVQQHLKHPYKDLIGGICFVDNNRLFVVSSDSGFSEWNIHTAEFRKRQRGGFSLLDAFYSNTSSTRQFGISADKRWLILTSIARGGYLKYHGHRSGYAWTPVIRSANYYYDLQADTVHGEYYGAEDTYTAPPDKPVYDDMQLSPVSNSYITLNNGSAQLRNIATRKVIDSLKGYNFLCYLFDGSYLHNNVRKAENGQVISINIHGDTLMLPDLSQRRFIKAFSNSLHVAILENTNSLNIVDVGIMKSVASIAPATDVVTCLDILRNDSAMITGHNEGIVMLRKVPPLFSTTTPIPSFHEALVYPNPTTGSILLRMPPHQTAVDISIYSPLGQRIDEFKNISATIFQYSIPFRSESIPSGMYYCVIWDGTSLYSIPFVYTKP